MHKQPDLTPAPACLHLCYCCPIHRCRMKENLVRLEDGPQEEHNCKQEHCRLQFKDCPEVHMSDALLDGVAAGPHETVPGSSLVIVGQAEEAVQEDRHRCQPWHNEGTLVTRDGTPQPFPAVRDLQPTLT